MIADGAFREDLYYRISTLTINLPPLAERHGDIPLLSRNILGQIGSRHLSLSSSALKAMEAYSWPGNIRQIYNTLVHASIHCSGNVIDAPDLPGEITGSMYERSAGSLAPQTPQLPADLPGEPGKLATHMASHEAELLRGLLARNKGNISATARQLGISRVTLYGKLRRYGLQKQPRE